MNLMAWFRKNNKKLMAVVVIVLMIVFTIEPVMSYLSSRRASGYSVVAHYADGKKIQLKDRMWAQKQLEILKALRADLIFRPVSLRLNPSQDLRIVLLGELLFAERTSAAETIGYVRQIVRQERLAVTDEQINALYEKEYPPDLYWLLLTKEAHLAGIRMPLEPAKEQLKVLIPRLQEGLTYSWFMTEIIKSHEVTEEQVIETFAELMTIVEYARVSCSTGNRTAQELLLETDMQYETMDAEYVSLRAGLFTSEVQQPGEEKIIEQFEKYKDEFPETFGEGNPYGFGYKLPDSVRLEYIAVRLDDVAETIPRPTQQEKEDFYQQHLSFFIQQVPSDPNDPNSEPTTRTRSFAEVEGLISKVMYQQKVDLKASQIISQAKSITEANLTDFDEEQGTITNEEMKRKAGDYENTAAKLTEEHKIKVYAGKTGLLGAVDIVGDKTLNTLYLDSPGSTNIELVRVLFAVEPLKASVLGPVDIRPPRLYQNIGLLKDARAAEGYAGKCMLLVRIIEAQKAAPPESINQTIDAKTVSFDEQAVKDVNTVRIKVVEDLKRVAAMDKAGRKAREFIQLAAKEDWDSAIDKLSRHLDNPDDFQLEKRNGIQRISETAMRAYETRYQGDPLARIALARSKAERMLIDKLFALIPDDVNTLPHPVVLFEFKPTFRYYCIKSLVIHRLYKEQYDLIKAAEAVRGDMKDADELAITFYSPANIVKRMNFQIIREEKADQSEVPAGPNQQSTNLPGEAKDTSGEANRP